jgi:hypothetical protein
MNFLLSEVLSHPHDLDAVVQEHWRRIVLTASREVRDLVTFRNKTNIRTIHSPFPEDDTEVAQLNALFTPYGMVALGDWVMKNPPPDRKESVYIHWPRLLAILPRLPSFDPRRELVAFSLMVWGFSEVFKRRDVLYYEFLRRKLLHGLASHAQNLNAIKGIPDLSQQETHLFAAMSKQLLKTSDPMIRALRSSFSATMEKAGPKLIVTRPSNQLDKFHIDVRRGCSMWHTGLSVYRESVIFEKTPAPVTVVPNTVDFIPRHRDDLFNEVLFARGIEANTKVVFGVRRSLKLLPQERITLVDIGDFAKYRTESGVPFFAKLRRKLGLSKEPWRKCAREMVFYMQEHMDGLTAPGGDYGIFYDMLEDVFPNASVDHILFIPYSAITERCVRQNKTALALEVKGGGVFHSTGARVAIVVSPPIPSADMATFRFNLIRRRNTVYICPPWKIPTVEILAPATVRREFKSGVHYDRPSHRAFCTMDLLLRMEDSPVRKHPQLRAWLSSYEKMSAQRFKELRKLSKKTFVDGTTRQQGHRAQYTQEEEEAICRLYRPGLTAEDKEELLFICKGRTWSNIRSRASLITKAKLNAGCVDINQLPVRNYNARIRKRIAENKEIASES